MVTEQTIISIDPGREKCGIAVVDRQKGILHKAIIETNDLFSIVQEWSVQYHTQTIIMGNGTSSKDAKNTLDKMEIDGNLLQVILVDEYRTTDEGRRRYWREHPPRGFWRLVPVTMQTPPCPVDDYVAVILGERYLGTN